MQSTSSGGSPGCILRPPAGVNAAGYARFLGPEFFPGCWLHNSPNAVGTSCTTTLSSHFNIIEILFFFQLGLCFSSRACATIRPYGSQWFPKCSRKSPRNNSNSTMTTATSFLALGSITSLPTPGSSKCGQSRFESGLLRRVNGCPTLKRQLPGADSK